MYIDRRVRKDGTEWFSITYIDPKTKKRTRMPRDKHPHFSTQDEAKKWVKTQDAAFHAAKQRSQDKVAWREKFYDFAELVGKFQIWVKQRAPNQNAESRQRLDYYIMPFFLETKMCNNVNQWRYFYQEFRTFLDQDAISPKYNRKISYSYKNHVINTLNQFTQFLLDHNQMDPENRVLCSHFPRHLVGSRSVEDVLSSEEFTDVHKRLTKIDPDVADFFYILRHTGMRFNELWSLPLTGLHSGQMEGALDKTLSEVNIKYFGYIFLESQCERGRIKDDKGLYVRKPLKSRKKIDMKGARTIPIADKECWNILARRFKTKKGNNIDMGQTLFFENVSKTTLERSINELYQILPYKKKEFHCLRHTYATFLIGETRNYFLAQAILGHRTLRIFESYNHLFELMNIRAKSKNQSIEEIA
jgi:integrase